MYSYLVSVLLSCLCTPLCCLDCPDHINGNDFVSLLMVSPNNILRLVRVQYHILVKTRGAFLDPEKKKKTELLKLLLLDPAFQDKLLWLGWVQRQSGNQRWARYTEFLG